MNQDAEDEALREWLQAHTAATAAGDKASDAWRRYSRIAQGKPVDLTPAQAKPPMKTLRAGVSGTRLPLAAMRLK